MQPQIVEKWWIVTLLRKIGLHRKYKERRPKLTLYKRLFEDQRSLYKFDNALINYNYKRFFFSLWYKVIIKWIAEKGNDKTFHW